MANTVPLDLRSICTHRSKVTEVNFKSSVADFYHAMRIGAKEKIITGYATGVGKLTVFLNRGDWYYEETYFADQNVIWDLSGFMLSVIPRKELA
jgi:hypothetical protein